ncbi:helix-turn-helix domain-containing protein [Nocardia otitidiscaviarum]|uniref:helix-turn-helix domain-containing protein n=1 Tax=Nocardia otitidiscaviarum TaxID=1823 RepID=UPI00245701C6|nr:helix-turn-helix domain-containing protein [Nocardia otitidiscaviarum]
MPLDTEWWLERNDRRILFARHGTTALFADTGTAAVSEHGHPAWKLVLPVRGERVEVYSRSGGRLDAPAVLVPPRWRHRSRVENGYVGLFLDAHTLPPHSGPIAVTRCAADRLRAALAIGPDVDSPPDLPAARAELLRMYGPATSPDPRITLALAHFDDTTTLTDLAREVGLSAPRLRALVQERVGVPLATLRRWYRLRNALTALRGGTIADAAADAGFADHAHLARTARDMLGRSPSSLTRPNAAS